MELLIPLETKPGIPLYEQIYSFIKKEIQSGRLMAGSRLPSTRNLAESLKVSRSTTQMAYEQLLSEGYVEAIPCRGYFVSKIGELVEVKLETGGVILNQKPAVRAQYLIDFSPRGIDLESFPYNIWRKISKDILIGDNKELFRSGDSRGEEDLRDMIRSYLYSARGVVCRSEQVIVGAGSEYLLMLLCQILGSGNTIAMENPTYKQAYRVFTSLGYEVIPVTMDAGGMSVTQLGKTTANLAYIMPSHHYPTGVVMPVKRRQELLRWAGSDPSRYLIEDDYDSEFRYKGKPIPALQGLDKKGKVIYMGTFSKAIAPAIRVGYLVLPAALMKVYQERYSFYASTVSRIDQKVLSEFIANGHFERHLNRMRTIYKNKHDVLLNELKPLEEEFLISGEYAGLHLLMTHKRGWEEERLVRLAHEKGIHVYGLSRYFIHRQCNTGLATIILGYANLSEEEIRYGIRILRECWSV